MASKVTKTCADCLYARRKCVEFDPLGLPAGSLNIASIQKELKIALPDKATFKPSASFCFLLCTHPSNFPGPSLPMIVSPDYGCDHFLDKEDPFPGFIFP